MHDLGFSMQVCPSVAATASPNCYPFALVWLGWAKVGVKAKAMPCFFTLYFSPFIEMYDEFQLQL